MRLYSGEDVICQVKEEQDDRYFVDNVVVAVPMEQARLSFAPWAPIAKEGIPIRIAKDYIVYVTEPNPDLAEQYNGLFNKIIAPQKKLVL